MTFQLMLAVLAGILFSMIAIAYRSNSARGIPPAFAAMGMGLTGVVWFGFRSFAGFDAPGWEAPATVWVWGIVNGVAQGFVVYLYRVGLRHGPLGPIWCAGNLTFVTPALYAVILLHESLTGLQVAGMAAAFLCVAVSSLGHGEEPGPHGAARATLSQRLLYGAVLLALVTLTGLVGVGLKHMAVTAEHGVMLNPRYNDCFMLGMYGVLLACVVGESVTFGRPAGGTGRLVANGLIAGVGSAGGMALTSIVATLPGGIGIAVISVSAVLGGAMITAFGFHDKRGPAWYATLALAVLSVILLKPGR